LIKRILALVRFEITLNNAIIDERIATTPLEMSLECFLIKIYSCNGHSKYIWKTICSTWYLLHLSLEQYR